MDDKEREAQDKQLDSDETRSTLDLVARQQASARSSAGMSLAETSPQLVDKLLSPKIIPDSAYHYIIPSLNFGNFSEDTTGVISDLQAEILFLLMDAANNFWLEDWLAKKSAAAWTVSVEESKARGADRLSKIFFSQDIGVTLKKQQDKKAFENK